MSQEAPGMAKRAGALHLSLVPFGIFSFVYVPANLIARGDPAATIRNITEAEGLYRSGIISHLLSQVIAVFLLAALYRLFSPIDKERMRLVVVFGAISVSIACAAELAQLAVPFVLQSGEWNADSVELQSRVMLLLESHRGGILLAQVFWGLWLLTLATLIVGSRCLPVWVGVLVMIGAAGYLWDSSLFLLGVRATTISQFTFAGELVLPVWLLITKSSPRSRIEHIT